MLGQALQCRVGRDKASGVALRLRWYLPGVDEPTIEFFGPEPVALEAPAGWGRITVQITSDTERRLFELEPADPGVGGGGKVLDHRGLFVRGHFDFAGKVNNPREADEQYDAPVDPVLTLDQARALAKRDPLRVTLTIANTEPPMEWPWVRRMRLKGAWLYVHPENERRVIEFLDGVRPGGKRYPTIATPAESYAGFSLWTEARLGFNPGDGVGQYLVRRSELGVLAVVTLLPDGTRAYAMFQPLQAQPFTSHKSIDEVRRRYP